MFPSCPKTLSLRICHQWRRSRGRQNFHPQLPAFFSLGENSSQGAFLRSQEKTSLFHPNFLFTLKWGLTIVLFLNFLRSYSMQKDYRLRAWLHWNVWRHLMSFETFVMLLIGNLSFPFSVSQWEASKMFQVTSDATHTFQCDQALIKRRNIMTVKNKLFLYRKQKCLFSAVENIFKNSTFLLYDFFINCPFWSCPNSWNWILSNKLFPWHDIYEFKESKYYFVRRQRKSESAREMKVKYVGKSFPDWDNFLARQNYLIPKVQKWKLLDVKTSWVDNLRKLSKTIIASQRLLTFSYIFWKAICIVLFGTPPPPPPFSIKYSWCLS